MLFTQSFPLDDLTIPWGTTLQEVADLTPGRLWHRDDGGWPNLRGACQSVFGVAATSCNLRGPGQHKPVMHIDYELASSPLTLTSVVTPTYWLQPLTQLLGPPTEATPDTEVMRPERGSLLFRAAWRRPGHHISLLVYCALDPVAGGPTATLALDWQDMLTAARPYIADVQTQEARLNEAASCQLAPQLFELREALPGGGTLLPPETGSPEAQLLLAKRALHHEGLYQTPAALQAQLSDRQVALWLVSGDSDYALSTKWHTVLLPGRRGPGPRVDLVTTRPAKGGGFRSLQVGELALYDVYNSLVLEQLAEALETQGYATIVRSENYDC
jgi:hypothetical protein